MFGNHIQAVDLIKTYYFATGPEIASRLCVSSVCMPVYLYACVGGTMFVYVHVCVCECVFMLFQVSPKIAAGLLTQVLYV